MKGVFEMTDSNKFKVLLYSDGSHQSFSAAVYTATLLKNMPNMHLTIVQVKEIDGGSMGIEYSWKELRPKFKRYYWGSSLGSEYNWKDTWPVSPNKDWTKRLFGKSALETKNYYEEILTQTNEIFSIRGLNVDHLVLCSNTSITDTSDTVDLIVDYATKNSFGLIIMGEREHSTLNCFTFADLEHSVRNKSTIPVVLVKKLSQDFIDNYLLDTVKLPSISSEIPRMTSDRSLNVLF